MYQRIGRGSWRTPYQSIRLPTILRCRKPKKVYLLLLISALYGYLTNLDLLHELGSKAATATRKKISRAQYELAIKKAVASSSNSISKKSKDDDFAIKRQLVQPRGAVGDCEWVDPKDVNQDPNFELFSTAIVAYPGAGKRLAFMQIEALTELTTKDDHWLDSNTNITRYAFFKTQYPHHEGIWSWGDQCAQTIYLLTNPRVALRTYLFTLHEINYSKDWETSYRHLSRVMTIRSPISSWLDWRERRFNAEINWWSWHIDYWMEGGLLRDIFTHELTTAQHWHRFMDVSIYSEPELREFQSKLTNVQPTYDPHCTNGDMPDCVPTAIASYERMMDEATGPKEVAKFTSVIEGKAGIKVSDRSVRDCAWRKVVSEKASGTRDDRDRKGPALEYYTFTDNQKKRIVEELVRVRDKYSSPEWSDVNIAQQLVGYMEEYIADELSDGAMYSHL